jgi:hypothetical protein
MGPSSPNHTIRDIAAGQRDRQRLLIPGNRMLNARRVRLGIGSPAIEEAPWSPQGQLASNVGSPPSSRRTWRVIRDCETLDNLDVYIAHCDAVVHLVGEMTGSYPGERGLGALLAKYPDLPTKLPPLSEALKVGVGVSYTQWEAWLALYHGKRLLIARAAETAEREPKYRPTDDSRTAQDAHLARLKAVERDPGCTFTSADSLAKYVFSGAILDLLVQAYAEEVGRDRDAAEGFIHEMAKKVAGDRNLDFEGKKQAVRNAIDIYQREISGGQTQTNIGGLSQTGFANIHQRARSCQPLINDGVEEVAFLDPSTVAGAKSWCYR